MVAIRTDGLTKRFGDVVAVDAIDLTIQEGEVFGFLGPNGAGKSTTINLLLDFIRPTDGSVEVLGMDAQQNPAAIRRRVGVLPDGYGFDDPLTGREYLAWAIRNKSADDDPDELLSLVGLTDDASRLAGEYSKGMQQRLAFAIALVGDPDLLILDEPSTGLDPNGIQQLRSVVRKRAENGTTVFFSSHILSEVEAVCDRVGVMNAGELVATDRPRRRIALRRSADDYRRGDVSRRLCQPGREGRRGHLRRRARDCRGHHLRDGVAGGAV